MYPCHSQMAGIVTTIIFYAEVPEWQWHYDIALDSLYLMATICFRLYIFFHRAFATPVHSSLFDLAFPYLAIPVHLAHPLALAPAPSQPVQQVPLESDPLEETDSSSSSSGASDDGYALADSSMANGFLPSESTQWSSRSYN